VALPPIADNATLLVFLVHGVKSATVSLGEPSHTRVTLFAGSNATVHMVGGFFSAQQVVTEKILLRSGQRASSRVLPKAAAHSVSLLAGQYALYSKTS
jgi:hypothetical protein